MKFKNQSTNNRKSKNSSKVESLDSNDLDDEGFIEGDIVTGKVLTAFCFGTNLTSQPNDESVPKFPAEKTVAERHNYAPTPRGITPPINGEHYTVKRSYQLRPSTVKKLNELKAKHPDVNVLFSTLVDIAISHYHNYIFYDDGTFNIEEEKKENS